MDQLETFREDFNLYLREVEEWANGVTASALVIETDLHSSPQISPCNYFERVKTFRKNKIANVASNS